MHKPNSVVIEEKAVLTLKDVLFNTELVKPNIPVNDKTLSWDGELMLFRTREFKKTNLIGRIPVQVKRKWTFHPFKKQEILKLK